MASAGARAPDPVDTVLDQWRCERPDLDVAAMGTIGRLNRLLTLVGRRIDAVLGEHGLSVGDFDVLAALRRSGEPFELKPSNLSRHLMLSPAGVTSRLDRLEQAGLVERRMDPDDRRSYLVRLSERGRRVIDEAVTDHAANETSLLDVLSAHEHRQLDRLMRRLLAQFDPDGAG